MPNHAPPITPSLAPAQNDIKLRGPLTDVQKQYFSSFSSSLGLHDKEKVEAFMQAVAVAAYVNGSKDTEATPTLANQDSKNITADLAQLDKTYYAAWKKDEDLRGFVAGNIPISSLVAVIEHCRTLISPSVSLDEKPMSEDQEVQRHDDDGASDENTENDAPGQS